MRLLKQIVLSLSPLVMDYNLIKFQINPMKHCQEFDTNLLFLAIFSCFLLKKIAKVERISYLSDVNHGYASADGVLLKPTKCQCN